MKNPLFLLLALFLQTTFSLYSQSPGDFDTTFSVLGWNIGIPNVNDRAQSVVQLPDGRILVGGYASGQSGLIMFTANGDRDETFGQNGVKILNVDSNTSIIKDLKLVQNSKIIVVGNTSQFGGSGYATRINVMGDVDITFGNQGFFYEPDYTFTNAEILNDNSVLIGGFSNDGAMSVIKLDSNGTIATSFGTNGIAQIPFPSSSVRAVDMKVDSAQAIYIFGETLDEDMDMVLGKLTETGSVDTSFGNSGFVTTTSFFTNSDEHAVSLNIDHDEKVIVSGRQRVNMQSGDSNMLIIRYLPNGNLDTSFAGNGFFYTDDPNNDTRVDAVLVQDDNKLFVLYTYNHFRSRLTSLNENGTIQTSFGDNGESILNFGNEVFTNLYDMQYQDDGKLLFAGRLRPPSAVDDIFRFLVARMFSGVLGVAEYNTLNDILIFPNPSSDILNISFSEIPGTTITYTISDTTGKEVLSLDAIEITNLNSKLDIRLLKSGFYFLTISSKTNSTTLKFLKD